MVHTPKRRSKVSRRNVLVGLAGLCAVPLKPQNISPVPEAPPPKFWFGDRVDYRWVDGTQQHSETGEVVGACWHPLDKQWQYSVIWLGSTLYKNGNCQKYYPNFDNRLAFEEELRRTYSERELDFERCFS